MSETLPIGAQVAGYRISGTLGRGGMGFVYEAEHAVLGRKAALKTLLPELLEDGDFRQRFVTESQTVAALDHPSIIPIYDAGDAGGGVYIPLRYVGGGDPAPPVESGALRTGRGPGGVPARGGGPASGAAGLGRRGVAGGAGKGGGRPLPDVRRAGGGVSRLLGRPGSSHVGRGSRSRRGCRCRGDPAGPADPVD